MIVGQEPRLLASGSLLSDEDISPGSPTFAEMAETDTAEEIMAWFEGNLNGEGPTNLTRRFLLAYVSDPANAVTIDELTATREREQAQAFAVDVASYAVENNTALPGRGQDAIIRMLMTMGPRGLKHHKLNGRSWP